MRVLNRRGTKCRVQCSGIDSPLAGTVEACANATVSYTVKGKGDSCDDTGLGLEMDDHGFIFVMDDGPAGLMGGSP